MEQERRSPSTLVACLAFAVSLPGHVGRAAPVSPVTAATAAAPVTVYVGTYTDTASRGIYRFTLDPATGAVTPPVLAGETKNPSFLALHPSGRFLYAVGEIDAFDGKKSGAVSAFAIDPRTADLTLLNRQPSEGTGPCHLIVDRVGRHLLVANYGGGSVAVLPIAADGRLQAASSVRVHQGTGPNKARQEKPHAHGVYLDPAERFALVPDLGADRIFVYGYDQKTGALEPKGSGALPPGAGPRHLAFDPSGRHVYVIDELVSTVTVFDYEAATGSLTSLQTLSTLPEGSAAANTTAEIAVSSDGRHLYGSNRGHDSLVVFAIEPGSGRLAAPRHVAAGGRVPRHFAIDPSGRYLLVAHQGSDSIALFRIDAASGVPAALGPLLSVPKPVCLLFRANR